MSDGDGRSDSVLYERRGTVGVMTLNRPDRMNAMDQAMLLEIDRVATIAESDHETHAVVLTGAGKGFSSGFDLKAQAANTPVGVDQWREPLRRDFDAVMRFWHMRKPTIAAVHGPALPIGILKAICKVSECRCLAGEAGKSRPNRRS
ncbi:MAG: enoyl-CoA hydratase/isomerase family protein [Burkholderiaceae bacterium]